ncbi:MAG TPA: hypothetical protein VK745_17875 [Polyangiaceae bacterium]|jgi:hypothetical protein|nr:hypothetical protein [Polyangiaceae bacterium]
MIDPVFETLWKNVLDHWDDERAHGVFLEHCQVTDQLAEAAARYRGMKGDSERGALADKRLAGVAIVALAKLEATRTQPRGSRSRTAAVILATAFGLTTVGFLIYLLASR